MTEGSETKNAEIESPVPRLSVFVRLLRAVTNWAAVSAVASVVSLPLLVAAIFYSATQVKTERQIAQSQFMLDYYTLVQGYNKVQMRLTSGDWASGAGPVTPEEKFQVARYMGLLEQIETFIESGVMPVAIVDATYSHRIYAIYNHTMIRQTYLESESFRWQLFLQLVRRLENQPVFQGLKSSPNSKPKVVNRTAS